MLANITSFIWGHSEPTENVADEAETKNCKGLDRLQEGLDTVNDDTRNTPEDDWVMVEKQALLSSPSSSIVNICEGDTRSEVSSAEERDSIINSTSNTTHPVSERTNSLLQAIDALRPAQKAARRYDERRLKRKQLEKHNLAREVASSSNKRTKRRHQLAPTRCSRAVNNRKC